MSRCGTAGYAVVIVWVVAVGSGVVACAVSAAFGIGAAFANVSIFLTFVASDWFLNVLLDAD